jgi:tRNA dimethylallyltransferase
MMKMSINMDNLDAIVLTGPTAVGKTDLSLALAHALDAEIISLDSRPVYRGMDLGTAKPTHEERESVPHHMIDILDPGERFTVADFIDRSVRYVRDIRARGRAPLFVGGTCMYLNALLNGYAFADMDMDPGVREDLEQRADTLGAPALHEELRAEDPEAAARIHPNDRQRIVRALEVFLSTGETLTKRNRRTALQDVRPPELRRLRVFGLCRPREILYERINKRATLMYNNGLIAETRTVLERRPDAEFFLQHVIGYAEALGTLRGELSQIEAERETAKATRSFARRQIIWFRRMRGITWLNRETVSAQTGLRLIGSALD